jgi:hypothetical protein
MKQPTVETILRDYSSGTHPASFSGLTNLRKYYPANLVKRALGASDSYTRHREVKRPTHFNPTFIRTRRKNFQSDLIQLNNYAEHNDGVNFILILIDSFTKKVWAEPLKNKSMTQVTKQFNNIMERVGKVTRGAIICTDFGKEYLNREFRAALNKHQIKHINPSTDKCSIVERVNLSLKKLIMEDMTDKESRRYIHRLQHLVKVYNSRYHRTIRMSPDDAEKEKNRNTVLEALELYWHQSARRKKRPPKFVVGDLVRFSNQRGIFRRGYDETHKIETARVRSVLHNLPEVMYEISEWDGEPIIGRWYESELTLSDGAVFKIEKIIGRRTNKTTGKKEVRVKWLGYPAKYNEWIDEEGVKDVHDE